MKATGYSLYKTLAGGFSLTLVITGCYAHVMKRWEEKDADLDSFQLGHISYSGGLVLRNQSYPSSFYDVYVSCDNCSDRTAKITESQGFTALIRSTEQSGKTWNMRWAMSQIPLNKCVKLLVL